jgi:hypothetical protein
VQRPVLIGVWAYLASHVHLCANLNEVANYGGVIIHCSLMQSRPSLDDAG